MRIVLSLVIFTLAVFAYSGNRTGAVTRATSSELESRMQIQVVSGDLTSLFQIYPDKDKYYLRFIQSTNKSSQREITKKDFLYLNKKVKELGAPKQDIKQCETSHIMLQSEQNGQVSVYGTCSYATHFLAKRLRALVRLVNLAL